ncbi:hypothetical protein DPMN_101434 [Dreissena polymorpha]|uniref:Uncharacterized protein n=1 Tax=Dreissena polymorpha TaxID=45954 RepID=A0A9D4LJF3_DREPO|nr:hypothetical protein DPMN_101434 [Dreissena polymorpha]
MSITQSEIAAAAAAYIIVEVVVATMVVVEVVVVEVAVVEVVVVVAVEIVVKCYWTRININKHTTINCCYVKVIVAVTATAADEVALVIVAFLLKFHQFNIHR